MEATATDPGQAILDEIAALEVERAQIEAKISAHMLDFEDIRRRQSESAPSATIAKLEASFAADELGLALHAPTRTVQCRLAQARRARGRLPLTWSAHTAGRVDGYRMSLIASAAEKLVDNLSLIELDARVIDYAAGHTTAQTKAWLKRFVARHAPDPTRVRVEKAKRTVWVDHQDDGMSFLHAWLPTADAVRIDRMLTSAAKQLSTDDARTLDQRRADLFSQKLLGTGADSTTGSGTVIGVTVPVTSLAGITDEPGVSFDGQYALPAELVRDLAVEPGTLFHRIITDPLGRILDVTETGRFPSAKLRVAVAARDGTCRFPTCTRPATESDLDHQIPHPRGPTNGANLRPLCRRHHRMKTHHIAEPTDLAMHARAPSRMEHDLATWATEMSYAA